MFWRARRPHIDEDDEAWLIACWHWLNSLLGPVEAEPQRQLILPTREFFPTTTATGHAKAVHYFDLVRGYMGLSEWSYKLVAQRASANLGQSIVFGGEIKGRQPEGTYSLHGNVARITYDPEILNNATRMVTVFAHELAHDILLTQDSRPPGGPEMEEFATDLAIAHLGFGLFGANTAFSFQQFTDFDRLGWRASRAGYLRENEWCFAIALFLALQGKEVAVIGDHLKPHLVTVIKRAHKYLLANPQVMEPLRSGSA